jgi:hypothetical protein
MFCDSRQNFRSKFIAISVGPHITRVCCCFVFQFYMRTTLRDNRPPNLKKSLEGMFRLHAAPVTQAETQSSLIERGTFSEFSTSSAMARSASAYAFLLASSSVCPYTITPGTAGISAIQRPSSSRSVSIFQCTSSLLTLAGGFLWDITFIGCRKTESVACDRGHKGKRKEGQA